MGGEITWTCIKGGPDIGKYIFQMKVYRDCSGTTFSQTSQTLDHHNYPSVGTTSPILLNFISVTDLSTSGSGSSGNACYTCAAGDEGAVSEYIWRSDPMTLAGAPPPEGWHFTWGTCCRSSNITNGMADDDFTLRAVMYPYTDPATGIIAPADPCFDSSPSFKELAKTLICTGYEFSYSHNAFDEELDELIYSWAEPLGDNWSYNPANPNSNALIFSAPYSVNSPIPGNPTMDNATGEITYNSLISGVFVTCVKVEARKCGQLVSEIYREVQVVLKDCSGFNQPTTGGIPNFNDPPRISPPFPGTATPFEKIVFAGDWVTFNIQAEDDDVYGGGGSQSVTLDASGGAFSLDFIDPNLCPNPPCAIFNNGTSTGVPPFLSPTVVNGFFEWQTHCSHLENICNNTSSVSNVFTFSIKAFDDFCPANGISIATVKITVVPPIPDLRCVSVEDNGDIVLDWNYLDNTPPTTNPIFIYHSTNFGGPYNLLDSTFFPTETYTHVGVDGDNSIHYYFLANDEGCDPNAGPLYSDTLQNILLDITPINLGASANLSWNAIRDPLLSSSAVDYQMYIKYDTSTTFYNYFTTPLLSYVYDAVRCQDNFQLYLEIPDASGCISRSSLEIANLGDTIKPIRSVITDVSVDTSGRAVISWTPSPGAYDYEVYKYGVQGWETIGTVLDPITTFVYSSSSADDFSETFSVRALDTCDNTKDKSLEHNSIHLTADLDECTKNLTLSWNEYINWESNVSSYYVVVEESDLNGLTVIRDTSLIDASDYVVTGLKDKYSYKIYVEANDGDTIFSAVSNQLVLIADFPTKPEYNYIDYASVNHDNGFIEVNCRVDNSAVIDHYDVMRSLRETNSFSKIGEIPFVGGESIHYTDESAKTNDEFYQYKIFPVDTCGLILFPPPSNMLEHLNDTSFAQTILLESEINLDYSSIDASLEDEYTNTIRFTEYEKWLGNVSEYRLYRSINREPFNLLPVYIWDRITSPQEALEFIDVVTSYGSTNGRFCYYIEAVEGNAIPYGPVPEGSFSNISCVSQTPIIYVPSVFTPNGDEHNEVFLPISYYISEIGYSFEIYNRGGSLIFTTNDPKKGWDGRFNGTLVQNGNYIYHLQYINGTGNLTEKSAVITIVR